MNVPDDGKCVDALLTEIKAPPETDSGCSYRETQAQSPLNGGALLSRGNTVLEVFIEWRLTIVGPNSLTSKEVYAPQAFPLDCTHFRVLQSG